MLHNYSPKHLHYFTCEKCDYKCSKKNDFNKHIMTKKHNATQCYPNATERSMICLCGKEYKHSSSYYRHKRTCNTTDKCTISDNHIESTSDKDIIILELLKQNAEFQKLMTKETSELKNIISEQNQKMLELATNMGSNHHNTINSNNKFNLNVFLNEKCKNAMSLTDFVKSINLTIDDFIQTGERGFIEGISNIIVERINNMDLHDRPIHCTDLKRETVYIKDSDKWEKDTNKEQLRKAVKGVAYKNERMRPIWYEETPEVDILGSENCDKFLKYSKSALGGCGKEETKLFEDKVMKNVLKEVTIDKDIE